MTIARATCPVCSSPTQVVGRAVVAPFVAELVGLPVGTATDLRRCADCTLDYFDPVYDEGQMSALYGGYRGDAYVAARKRWEPWYGARVNDAFATGQAAVQGRRGFMTGVLKGVVAAAREFDCVVDYGGDEGQFFPDVPARRRVVVDLSQKGLPEGVERKGSLDDVGEAADLVVIAHVLEHLADPLATLREIRAHIRSDGVLYVEVPLDRPRLQPFHATDRAGRWRDRISARRTSFVPLDFASGISRQYRRRVPRLAALKMSEHVNYFDRHSLERALHLAGFQPVHHVRDPDADVGGLRMGRLGMVALPIAETPAMPTDNKRPESSSVL